ncbi:DUF7521 family protein [Halococcoides cellulosivorans]|uniref:Uncharacterized protein n=1 Tax=Halococcoides cellulosivorans TaxID=1679096 RepID=A0A2R4X2S5_9EURY|nr:hypothetical protein [Halococcoides cellulosivorans]AWB28107.1 hypothetical protein HARCEL1_10510 [Halococcoides cellulosivorans]
MSPIVETAVVALKTIILLLGATITLLSGRAYRRGGSRAVGLLAAGFGLVTLGAFLAGLSNMLWNFDIATSLLVESVLTVVGFAIILYSVYAE